MWKIKQSELADSLFHRYRLKILFDDQNRIRNESDRHLATFQL